MNRRQSFNRGRWEVARERFHVADLRPPAEDAGAMPLAALIPEAMKGMKLDAHAQVASLAAAWPEIVGPQLAPNTRPAHLENGVLLVYVSHPAWIMELRGAPAAEILARLQARHAKIGVKSLRFAVDPEPPAR